MPSPKAFKVDRRDYFHVRARARCISCGVQDRLPCHKGRDVHVTLAIPGSDPLGGRPLGRQGCGAELLQAKSMLLERLGRSRSRGDLYTEFAGNRETTARTLQDCSNALLPAINRSHSNGR